MTDFKFTDLEKKQALVRFVGQTSAFLLEALTKEGSSSLQSDAPDLEASFKVKLKEEAAKLVSQPLTGSSSS